MDHVPLGKKIRILKNMKWPDNIEQARKIQESLAEKVRCIPLRTKPKLIAGVDAAFSESQVFAAACLFAFPALSLLDEACAVSPVSFPYISGYLSFREGEPIIRALRLLKAKPDVILVDGQGIAHPRLMGIASHIGVLLDQPTIGCAKSRLVGEFEEPGWKRGARAPLRFQEKIVGAVVRTRNHVRPLFISPGHKVSLKNAVEIVLQTTRGFRIPEPLRRADILSKQVKRKYSTG
jgi:deoxyribonuclease V